MNYELRIRPKAITWKQFANKGYCAIASLKREVRIGVLSIATLGVAAQAEAALGITKTQNPIDDVVEEEKEMSEVTVTGTMTPLTLLQSARIVSVLSRQDIEQAGVQSINDLFKLATGVDVRQRGGFGIQTDISIDGGIFDQISLLLNGVCISNPQTGHLSADFPVSISDIERIEVLEGAASRIYGGQSFGGAINIVTRHEESRTAEIGVQGGSFVTFEADARLGFCIKGINNRISGGGGRSNGGTANSDWKKGQFYYQGDYGNEHLKLEWQFGFSKKAYGANTFYSAAYPNQFERNERYLLSVSAETKGKLCFTPQVYWNRNYDNFELIRNERFGENFHRTDIYGLKAGGYFRWIGGKTAMCAEFRHEGILSTNLGQELKSEQYVAVKGEEGIFYTRQDTRTTVSFNLEHNILLAHWTVSAGLLTSMTTSVDHTFRFYPGIDVAYRPNAHWKVFFSYNKGFRLPTFTDLYYKSVTLEGNKGLKPENNHSVQIGGLFHKNGYAATVRVFFHHGSNMIDWVMYHPEDTYHSTAFKLDNMGVQAEGRFNFDEITGKNAWIKNLTLGYTHIRQGKHDGPDIYKSSYTMEYLRHKFIATLHHKIYKDLAATWSIRVQDRMGNYISAGELVNYSTYATLDIKLQWTSIHYNVFVQGTNITNNKYFDLGNVPQPGIWIMAGARWKL
ncbi:MAG: TonB-dependent receptor [Bacteroidaceae bacterium]|nr:TonB-dependent receptor [Bacteroidaceae bacterium]